MRKRAAGALAGVILAAVAMAGCLGSPSRVRSPAREYLAAESPRRIWATLADGTRMALDDPQLIGDTLVALAGGSVIALPADNVTDLRVKRVSYLRTGVLVGGAGVTLARLLALGDPGEEVPVDTSDYYHCRFQPNPDLCM